MMGHLCFIDSSIQEGLKSGGTYVLKELSEMSASNNSDSILRVERAR